MRLAALLLLLSCSYAYAGIGEITLQQKTAVIDKKSGGTVAAKLKGSIDQNDTVKTSDGTIGITFKDKTTVKITPNSKLLIDDFVYDPSSNSGSKLGLKVALGTVRYASGQIAKMNPSAVDIKTPTATIAVRGTDFAMAVDETGGSTVVLLPGIDGKVGMIEVMTAAGSVTLNKAYQMTSVTSGGMNPSAIIQLKSTMFEVSNNILIKNPEPVEDPAKADKEKEKEETQSAKKEVQEEEKPKPKKHIEDLLLSEEPFMTKDGINTYFKRTYDKHDVRITVKNNIDYNGQVYVGDGINNYRQFINNNGTSITVVIR